MDKSISVEWDDAIASFSYWLAVRNLTAGTIETRRSQLRRLARVFPDGPGSFSMDRLGAWFVESGWCAQTKHAMVSCIRSFYRWAFAAGVVEVNPVADLPSVRRSPGVPRPVPEDVWRRVRDAAEPRARLMIEFAALMGLRRGEIAVVHRDDLVEDLVGYSLLVHGKGGRERLVPMPDGLVSAVKSAEGWVFPNDQRPGTHISADRVARVMMAAVRAAGESFTPHQLRHRYATVVWRGTRDLLAVQQLLGHVSPATTQVYVQTDAARLRAAALVASVDDPLE